jgi:hypothetical protein
MINFATVIVTDSLRSTSPELAQCGLEMLPPNSPGPNADR